MHSARPYHHGDLHTALVDAALDLAAERGVAGVSLREVARRVGVSSGAPYRHFPTRQALLSAAAQRGYVALSQALTDGMRSERRRNVGGRLREIAVAYVRFALEHAAMFRIMYAPELYDLRSADPLLADAHGDCFRVLLTVMRDMQEVRMLPPGDPSLYAIGPWSTIHGFAVLAVNGQLAGTPAGEDPLLFAERLVSVPGGRG